MNRTKEHVRKSRRTSPEKDQGVYGPNGVENHTNVEEVENSGGEGGIWGGSDSYEAEHEVVVGWSMRVRSLGVRAPRDLPVGVMR